MSGKIANQNLATTKKGRIVNVGRLGGTHGDFNFDLHAVRRIDDSGVTFRTRSIEEIREIFDEVWRLVPAPMLVCFIEAIRPAD